MSRENIFYLFDDADDFLKNEIIFNERAVSKEALNKVALSVGIENPRAFNRPDLCEMIFSRTVTEQLARDLGIGVSAMDYQVRFGLSGQDMRKLAEENFLDIVRVRHLTINGKLTDVYLFDAYQFWEMKGSDILAWQKWQAEQNKQSGKGRAARVAEKRRNRAELLETIEALRPGASKTIEDFETLVLKVTQLPGTDKHMNYSVAVLKRKICEALGLDCE